MTLRPTSRGKIIGVDARIRSALQTIDRVAHSMCTVLVTGESGTGKELFVAALHDASERRAGPLVTINCGAIPIDLVEAELFGHAKGAFTGAVNARSGHVAAAEKGTLFLDEIGDLPPPVQVKLLRLLQQREYTPLGESRAVKCDVRIVAATHRDLAADVAAGRFREDLFYRLNVIRVHLPPLRERPLDVRLLAEHFFREHMKRSGREDLQGLSPTALTAIERRRWPGNVRALENAIERGVLLARGPLVEPEDVFDVHSHAKGLAAIVPQPGSVPSVTPSAPIPQVVIRDVPAPESEAAAAVRRGSDPNFPRVLPTTGMDLSQCAERYQNNLIQQALKRTSGNKNRAAQLLGLNRTTLVEMMRRRGLQP